MYLGLLRHLGVPWQRNALHGCGLSIKTEDTVLRKRTILEENGADCFRALFVEMMGETELTTSKRGSFKSEVKYIWLASGQ